VVGLDRVLAVGAVGDKDVVPSSDLGVAMFKVAGSDSLLLGDDDFFPVIADVALMDGTEASMTASKILGSKKQMANCLTQNFPNPCNPNTTIPYSIKGGGRVTLTIYDVAGRMVRRLVDEKAVPGLYRAAWDGTNGNGNQVASGVYFCKLVTGEYVSTKKLVMVK
jgi:hypothetical protein